VKAPRRVLSEAKVFAVLGIMETTELSNALQRHAEKLRKDAEIYDAHGNTPLVERTQHLADTFARLGEQVFGSIVRVSEEP
jgi:hypothetical protein